MSSNSIDRRNFLKLGCAGVAAATVSTSQLAQGSEEEPAVMEKPGVPYRTLGRTGLKVSVIGYGAMRTREATVIRAAFDKGVNWLDTARNYMGGRNEGICGEALKGYRDKIYVTTKTGGWEEDRPKEAILRDAEESLRSLQTDHVDLFLLHGVDEEIEEVLMNQEIKEVLAQLRKDGKTRFIGLSSHSTAEAIDVVLKDPDKFYDAILVPYNYASKPAVKEAIARAAKANIGVIAMKTQEGGYKTKELGDISPHQAALKWVLQDKNVATTIPAMVNLQQVEEDTEVMRMLKLTRVDEQILRRYSAAIAPFYCVGCRECKPTCSKSVDIPTVNRCLMYAEGYGDLDLARTTYAELPMELTAAACTDCPECVAECPNGLRVAHKMRRAQTLFT